MGFENCGGSDSGMRYRPLWLHATGGLGEIFGAIDIELHRQVALKQMQDVHAKDRSSRNRFVAEAKITGNLEHPGIVPVYGVGAGADGRPYYAMRFVKGETLTSAIHRFHSGLDSDFAGASFDGCCGGSWTRATRSRMRTAEESCTGT